VTIASLGRLMPGGATAISPRRAGRLVERNVHVYRRRWLMILSGFFEPLFYLLGLGFGLGALVGDIDGVPYAVFVAPALMATAAMNGALADSTFNMFFKLKYAKTYDAILSTPLGVGDVAAGEVAWALMRGSIYAVGFIVVMFVLGLVVSPLAIFAVPAALLIGFATAGVGTACCTFMRTWQDFDLITVVTLPMFLFSATFFPITQYPPALQLVVEVTPLYRGIHLIRGLTTGTADWTVLIDIGYLLVLGLVGLSITSRRLGRLLLR
jgi:lipooligosaccharide transport system permease protein